VECVGFASTLCWLFCAFDGFKEREGIASSAQTSSFMEWLTGSIIAYKVKSFLSSIAKHLKQNKEATLSLVTIRTPEE